MFRKVVATELPYECFADCYTKTMKKEFALDEAKEIGDALGINFDQFDLEQFRMGLGVELEHGSIDPETNVTDSDVETTGKIAWAHLKEIPDYYTRLAEMESEAGS